MTSPSPTPVRAGHREWAALGVVTVAVVLLAIDGTVLALAVPSLTAHLEPSATQLLWIGDVYSFCLAGLLVTMGNVADRIGRRRLLLIGSAGFGVASALAAFATTPELLIAGRALLGVAGATIMPSTLSIVRNLFEDPAQRTRAIAVWSAGATGGAAIGPLVGGALLEHFWWGSVFLINVPVVLVVLVAGALLVPESRNPRPGRIDLVSAALSMAAIVPAVYAVKTFASHGWDSGAVVALVGGALAGWVFVRRQRGLAEPLLDVSLFRQPAFSGAVAANTMAIFAFVGMLFFFSQYLQLVRGLSPLEAGLTELPATIASIAAVAVVGVLVVRLGRGPAIALGLLVAGLGMALLAVAEGASGLGWLVGALVVMGLGASVAMTASTDAVVTAAPRERAGAASAISETAYELGVALGIAVLGAVHTAVYRAEVEPPPGLTGGDAAAFRDSLASAVHHAEASTTLDQAQHAFTVALQTTSAAAAALTVLAALVAWRVIPASTSQARHD